MGLFDKLFKKEQEPELEPVNVADDAIAAVADGEMIDVTTVSDEVFAEKMMGESTAFRFAGNKVTLCAPANGTLSVLFPTGHAYGITRNDGVEILVHCGINTVEANGDGFRLLGKKQGDAVKAGDPIVEVDLKKLSAKYDMSTILIITNPNEKEFTFAAPRAVKRGEIITA